MAKEPDIDVFDYLDYRAYLKDYYVAKKAISRAFSHRAFSRKVGVRTPNHLKRVMDGERNLTAEMATRYAKALHLDGDHAAYFCDLTAFNQASSTSARNAAYERLTGFRGYRSAHKLDMAHAAYHSMWYLPAIREMALRRDFQGTAEWIAQHLMPVITLEEAQTALDTLLKLGLLERNDAGEVIQTNGTVSTGAETQGLHIGNYHRTMMNRAAASIDLVPAPDRDISSLTLCLGPTGLHRIKERLRRLRQELLALAEQEEDEAIQVIQLNLQLFPLSDRTEDAT